MLSNTIPVEDLALPLDSLVLITGATGFIASHIVRACLSFGYRVRGTVRTTEKGEASIRTHNHDNYSFAVVPDISAPKAFDEAIKDIDGIVHVANDMSKQLDPSVVVPQAKRAILSLLEAADRTQSVSRVVLTSSSFAVTMPKPGVEFTVDANTWNLEAVEEAWNTPADRRDDNPRFGEVVYSCSKVEVERAAYNFVETRRPRFVLNSVCPNFNAGRILPGVAPGPSGSGIINVYNGKPDLAFIAQWMIDVEDDAKIHVACLADSTIRAERVLGYAHPFNWNDILAVIREIRPSANIINDIEGQITDLMKVNTDRGAELLKKWWNQDGYTSFEESVRRNLEHIK